MKPIIIAIFMASMIAIHCYAQQPEYIPKEKTQRSYLANYDSAEIQLTLALEMYDENLTIEGEVFFNLGTIALKKRNYQQAADYFKRTIEIGNQIHRKENYNQIAHLNRYGQCLIYLGEYKEAIKNFRQAIQYNTPGYQWDGNLDSLIIQNHYLSYEEILYSYLGLAYVTAELNIFELAKKYLRKSEEIIYDNRLSAKNDEDLKRISESYKELADCAIKTLNREDRINGTSDNTDEIFRITELIKTSSISAQIDDIKAKRLAKIPTDKISLETEFKNERDSIRHKILKLADSDSLVAMDKAKSDLHLLNQKYHEYLDSLSIEYPDYMNKKYDSNIATPNLVQGNLESYKTETALISYNISSENEVYITAITKDSIIATFQRNIKLMDELTAFRNSLMNKNEILFTESSIDLYQSLIKPIEHSLTGIEKLIIVPDGVLGYVPFETLINSDGKYMIEQYNISYELSSTLWLNRKSSRKLADNQLLAYAPDFDDDGHISYDEKYGIAGLQLNVLENIPGAKEEVSAISNHLSTDIKIGREATEIHFKEKAKDYDILHFATHSIINETDSDYTKLYFQDGVIANEQSDEDGLLHAYELDNIELNARLVTLSACSSGFGKAEGGEGGISLARSFTAAGVPSVVMSLWPTSEKSTPILMENFYENLAGGMRKDDALNQARRTYLKEASASTKHPFYWGGFILVGDSAPLYTTRSNWIWYLLAGIVLLFMSTLVVSFRWKHESELSV